MTHLGQRRIGGAFCDLPPLAKAFKQAAISAYGMAGPEFVRRIIAEGADEIGETVRDIVAAFIETTAPAGSDGQIDRTAQRLGLIAAAGELVMALEIVPWPTARGLEERIGLAAIARTSSIDTSARRA